MQARQESLFKIKLEANKTLLEAVSAENRGTFDVQAKTKEILVQAYSKSLVKLEDTQAKEFIQALSLLSGDDQIKAAQEYAQIAENNFINGVDRDLKLAQGFLEKKNHVVSNKEGLRTIIEAFQKIDISLGRNENFLQEVLDKKVNLSTASIDEVYKLFADYESGHEHAQQKKLQEAYEGKLFGGLLHTEETKLTKILTSEDIINLNAAQDQGRKFVIMAPIAGERIIEDLKGFIPDPQDLDQSDLIDFLNNKQSNIKEIAIPCVSKEHWYVFNIKKQEIEGKEHYQITVFDSMNNKPKSLSLLNEIIHGLDETFQPYMQGSIEGSVRENISNIRFVNLNHPQQTAYACGDLSTLYLHQVKSEYGNTDKHSLIDTYWNDLAKKEASELNSSELRTFKQETIDSSVVLRSDDLKEMYSHVYNDGESEHRKVNQVTNGYDPQWKEVPLLEKYLRDNFGITKTNNQIEVTNDDKFQAKAFNLLGINGSLPISKDMLNLLIKEYINSAGAHEKNFSAPNSDTERERSVQEDLEQALRKEMIALSEANKNALNANINLSSVMPVNMETGGKQPSPLSNEGIADRSSNEEHFHTAAIESLQGLERNNTSFQAENLNEGQIEEPNVVPRVQRQKTQHVEKSLVNVEESFGVDEFNLEIGDQAGHQAPQVEDFSLNLPPTHDEIEPAHTADNHHIQQTEQSALHFQNDEIPPSIFLEEDEGTRVGGNITPHNSEEEYLPPENILVEENAHVSDHSNAAFEPPSQDERIIADSAYNGTAIGESRIFEENFTASVVEQNSQASLDEEEPLPQENRAVETLQNNPDYLSQLAFNASKWQDWKDFNAGDAADKATSSSLKENIVRNINELIESLSPKIPSSSSAPTDINPQETPIGQIKKEFKKYREAHVLYLRDKKNPEKASALTIRDAGASASDHHEKVTEARLVELLGDQLYELFQCFRVGDESSNWKANVNADLLLASLLQAQELENEFNDDEEEQAALENPNQLKNTP